jgi:hypothetical protein
MTKLEELKAEMDEARDAFLVVGDDYMLLYTGNADVLSSEQRTRAARIVWGNAKAAYEAALKEAK